MKGQAHIEAGVCGFVTDVTANCDDGQQVAFALVSDCEKIQGMARRIGDLGPVDAYAEIDARATGPLVTAMRAALCGCCSGCAVPVGVFKAMQVAAGLALPKDIRIALTAEG